MKTIWPKRGMFAITALLAMGLTTAAFAQYVWLDEKGTKQFSDVPPPPSVPKKRILKAPGAQPQALSTQASDVASEDNNVGSAPASNAAAAKTPAQLTTAERNVDFQKRKIEQAEKEKKAGEEAARKKEQAANCERARDYQRTLDSGIRITQVDKSGERVFMTDEQRAQATKEAKRALADCK
jgi:hypothetical protein